MSFATIESIVDVDRYPLHRPRSAAVARLVREGRAKLEQDALFTMPGFVRPEAARAMAAELEARVPIACRLDALSGSYSYGGNGTVWPAGHPRLARHRFRYHQVLNHQIPNDSPLRHVFRWEPLREALRRIMGYATFHRSECPHLALTAKVAGAGDTDGWHFDSNDVVFSVVVQEPEQGGLFEYAPNVRTDDDENYDTVAQVFAGTSNAVRRARLAVGDLNVFQGNRTLHRVSPVEGARRRIVGLFSYDRRPGTNFGEAYIETLRQYTPGAAQAAALTAAASTAAANASQPAG